MCSCYASEHCYFNVLLETCWLELIGVVVDGSRFVASWWPAVSKVPKIITNPDYEVLGALPIE